MYQQLCLQAFLDLLFLDFEFAHYIFFIMQEPLYSKPALITRLYCVSQLNSFYIKNIIGNKNNT